MSATMSDQDAITLRNLTTSPLLRLPPELRNAISAYVLTDDAFGIVPSKRLTGAIPDMPTPKNCLALLATCRSLYHDTKLMPFALNTFSFPSLARMKHCTSTMLSCQQDVIKSVSIDFRYGGYSKWQLLYWKEEEEEEGLCELADCLPGIENVVIAETKKKADYPICYPWLSGFEDHEECIADLQNWLQGASKTVKITWTQKES